MLLARHRLREEARKIALEFQDAEPGTATTALLEWARANRRDWSNALDDDVTARCMLLNLLSDFRHKSRSPAQEPPEPQSATGGRTAAEARKCAEGAKRHAHRVRQWITGYQVFGGKPIMECTYSDLAESIRRRDVQISGMALARDFETAVAERLLSTTRSKVKNVLTPEELSEIYYAVKE